MILALRKHRNDVVEMIIRIQRLFAGISSSPHADRAATMSSDVAPWWSRTSTMLILMVLSTMPLWFTSTPPLTDFLGHIARYHVALQIDHNPLLSRNWDYHWTIISNLGVDLLILPMARIFGLEPAAWIVAASLPPIMIWGIFRASKAIYGSVPITAMATMPFAIAYPYQYGFVNYWLAAGLAVHAFAFWVNLEHTRTLRCVLFIPISFVLWICHMHGWVILGTLVGGYELSRTIKAEGKLKFLSLVKTIGITWPLLTITMAMFVWRSNSQGAETYGWFDLGQKLSVSAMTLRDQNQMLDIGTIIAVTFLIYFGIRDRRASMDPRFAIAALLFASMIIILPYELFGCGFAGGRLYPLLFITSILSVRISNEQVDPQIIHAIPIVFAVLYLSRMIVSTVGSVEYEAANQRHLIALKHIERGASVAVLVRRPCKPDWRLLRIDHVSSMAIVRRDAFVNSQWAVPGGQLLRAKRAAGTEFNNDPSQFVTDLACSTDLRPILATKITAIPREYFDYLWVFDFNPITLPAIKYWKPVYRDENTILYRKSAT